MVTDVKHELIISGSGTASGGDYSHIRITGNGNIQGEVHCESIYTNGSSRVSGDLTSRSLQVNGSSKLLGKLHSQSIKINGLLQVKENIQGDSLKSYGALQVEKDCEVEDFQAKGSFEVNGLLNAETINIQLYSKSYAKEIGGKKITVRKQYVNLLENVLKRFFDWRGILTVDLIEGDDIHLEGTHARMVRGKRVVIGKDCRIEQVEYTESLDIQDGAKVDRHERQ